MRALFMILATSLILCSCDNKPTAPLPPYQIVNNESALSTDATGREYNYVTIDVLVDKGTNVHAINAALKSQYLTDQGIVLWVWYYDDLNTAKNYRGDKNATDAQIETMFKHVVSDCRMMKHEPDMWDGGKP